MADYVKGGAAWTDLHTSVVDSCSILRPGYDKRERRQDTDGMDGGGRRL